MSDGIHFKDDGVSININVRDEIRKAKSKVSWITKPPFMDYGHQVALELRCGTTRVIDLCLEHGIDIYYIQTENAFLRAEETRAVILPRSSFQRSTGNYRVVMPGLDLAGIPKGDFGIKTEDVSVLRKAYRAASLLEKSRNSSGSYRKNAPQTKRNDAIRMANFRAAKTMVKSQDPQKKRFFEANGETRVNAILDAFLKADVNSLELEGKRRLARSTLYPYFQSLKNDFRWGPGDSILSK